MTETRTESVAVALMGNPNTGKSTLFQALTGLHQRTGNYPGVTVEKKTGIYFHEGTHVTVIDLPGTYSLAPRSPDEIISVDVLLGRQAEHLQPDVVVCIVDAANLRRNLYLVSQIMELGRPVVVALNMMDLASARGIEVDSRRLSQRMGIRMVPLRAHRREGISTLNDAILAAAREGPRRPVRVLPSQLYDEASRLAQLVSGRSELSEFMAMRMILDTTNSMTSVVAKKAGPKCHELVQEARNRLTHSGIEIPAVEAISRYRWIGEVMDGCVTSVPATRSKWNERLDTVLTHRVWGCIIFFVAMFTIFEAVFAWAEPLMRGVEWGMSAIDGWVSAYLPPGPLQSLLTDGVIAGVGGILTFLPQIMILFLLIAVLEDCGYLARAAYLMDRPMAAMGLGGKSFIPLLSSFACAIPGILSTRVIENRRDRLLTILIAPLMSCSARLPVYTLMIETFVPERRVLGGWLNLQTLVLSAAYLIGILAASAVVWLLRKTVLRGPRAPFLLELPSFKWPCLTTVLRRMIDAAWSFVRRAGTLILAISIVVWALAYFPRHPGNVNDSTDTRSDSTVVSQLGDSYLGRMGRWLEPVVRPLGWDWRIGCAVIASFPAREVVISAMGVIYNLSEDSGSESDALRHRLRQVTWEGTNQRVFNLPVALSLIVFFALCAQCAGTLAVIYRETNHIQWPIFTFVYMTSLAYVAAWCTYRMGIWAGWA